MYSYDRPRKLITSSFCTAVVLHFCLAWALQSQPICELSSVSHEGRVAAEEDTLVKQSRLSVLWLTYALWSVLARSRVYHFWNQWITSENIQYRDLVTCQYQDDGGQLWLHSHLMVLEQAFIHVTAVTLHIKNVKTWICCGTPASVLGHSN